MDYVGMGCRIHRGRRLCHLTQVALAEKAGISVSFIGHIERGTRKASLETIVKICGVLNMSLDEIVLGVRPAQNVEPQPSEEDILLELNRVLGSFKQNW